MADFQNNDLFAFYPVNHPVISDTERPKGMKGMSQRLSIGFRTCCEPRLDGSFHTVPHRLGKSGNVILYDIMMIDEYESHLFPRGLVGKSLLSIERCQPLFALLSPVRVFMFTVGIAHKIADRLRDRQSQRLGILFKPIMKGRFENDHDPWILCGHNKHLLIIV